MKKLPLLVITLLLMVSLTCSCQTTSPQTQQAVRIGYLELVTNLPFFVADEKGFFTDAGVKYVAIPYPTSNQLAEDLAAGHIDCFTGASVVPVLQCELVSPGKIKIFSTSRITENNPFDAIFVVDSSPIHTLADLQGRKIAVFPGATASALLKKFLTDNGIDTSTVTFVSIAPDQNIDALTEGKVDAIYAYEPTVTAAAATPLLRKLYGSVYAALLSPNPISVSAINSGFAKEHPKTAASLITAFERAFDFLITNDEESRALLAKRTGLPQNVAEQCNLLYMLPHRKIDPENLRKFALLLEQIGEIKHPIKTETIIYHSNAR
jgi:NitT/TauT family transport system substrate-binding protein